MDSDLSILVILSSCNMNELAALKSPFQPAQVSQSIKCEIVDQCEVAFSAPKPV